LRKIGFARNGGLVRARHRITAYPDGIHDSSRMTGTALARLNG